jgi:hypothetical protein
VVRRIVDQLNVHTSPVGELHQTVHELCSGTTDFGTIVQIDLNSFDTAMHLTSAVPPTVE